MTAGTASAAEGQEDLQAIRARYLQLVAPKGLDPERPEVARMYATVSSAAREAMKSQRMEADDPLRGSWRPIKRSKHGIDGGTFGRVQTGRTWAMAQAYGMPGCELEGDETLRRHIVAALEFIEPEVRDGGKRRGNWWAWDVKVPRDLGNILLLTDGELPPALRQKLETALLALVKERYPPDFMRGGANLLYVAQNQLRVAVLTGRTDFAEAAAESYAISSSREGELAIQEDASYHFHGHGLNMGYGRIQLEYVSQFLYLTGGTAFALPAESVAVHEAWFRRFVVWNSYRGRVSPFTIGRSIARDGAVGSGQEAEAAAFLYADTSGGCRDLALSFLAEWYRSTPEKEFLSPQLLSLTPLFEPDLEKAKPMPTGARFFPLSDYLACRREGFYAAVRMQSRWRKAWFSIRNENVRGQHSADGTLVLMTDGSEWGNAVIPTMDWQQLSGITAAKGFALRPERPGDAPLAGGLAHRERYGTAGFAHTIRKGKAALQAHKSYTVLENAVALLGSAIGLHGATLPEGETVHTVIHQCPLREEDTQFVVDGEPRALEPGTVRLEKVRRIHCRNYGYRFPSPTDVILEVKTTTRTFRHVNRRYFNNTKYTRRFYTLRIDHGPQPDDGGYAVVVYPGISPETLEERAASPAIRVEASEAVHLVEDTGASVRFACFFAPAERGGFASDRPLVAAVSTGGDAVFTTVQDPARQGGMAQLRFPVAFRGPGAIADGEGTRVTLSLEKDMPVAAAWTR